MKYRMCLPWNGLFLRLTCTWEETCESVWPPNASLYVSSTCVHLRLLSGPFDQGFSRSSHKKSISITLTRRLMPSSIDSETLVNREKGFSADSKSFFSKMKLRTEIWRKTYILLPCFVEILPWLPIMPLQAWTPLFRPGLLWFQRIFAQFASKIFTQSIESVSPLCRCFLKLWTKRFLMFCVKNLTFLWNFCSSWVLVSIVVIQDSEDGKRTVCKKMR